MFNVNIFQLPFLFGVTILEKIAAPVASLFVGQTGTQLFLTDGNPNKPPLLLRMASDCEDGKFMYVMNPYVLAIDSYVSVIQCLQDFTAFVDLHSEHFDFALFMPMYHMTVSIKHIFFNQTCFICHKQTYWLFLSFGNSYNFYIDMVGWRTSSIRRETELGKPPSQFLDGYKHVVDVKYCTPVPSDGSQFTPRAMKAKETAQNASYTENTVEYHQIMEEEMIRGLQQLGWKKVDVNFRSATLPFFAHYNIHVKNERLHNAGVGVIAHVADSLRQSEATILAPSF
ncbi:hypothetical protein Ahy_A10g051187 isoform F [Arachis hypogaea]|uniref:DUF676 domain-containing protein n=1 Tax=Arachis hypogaea TaxID=3818 RepID=A0A445BBV4_ARAHY|nr:hypothetical protein Ahy_A10g051187 isoform F [Arachis hypogaea]